MAHWRETYKPARFGPLDARAGLPLLVTLVHFRWYTVAATVLIMLLFWMLERRGLSVPSAFRAFRAWVIGDMRPAKRFQKTRRGIDYERRTN